MSPALAGRFLTTAPPGKPPNFSFKVSHPLDKKTQLSLVAVVLNLALGPSLPSRTARQRVNSGSEHRKGPGGSHKLGGLDRHEGPNTSNRRSTLILTVVLKKKKKKKGHYTLDQVLKYPSFLNRVENK